MQQYSDDDSEYDDSHYDGIEYEYIGYESPTDSMRLQNKMPRETTSPDYFEIRMQGHAVIPHPAERAKIHVEVSSSGLNKVTVSDEVLTTTRHIEGLLSKMSPQNDSPEAKAASPLAHWNKSSLSSTSHVPYSSGKTTKPRQYDSKVTFDIRFKDFKALGAFGSQISSIPHVEVKGIDWLLTTNTRDSFQSQLRKDAARDALEKAADYCEVLGCHNLKAIELQEGQHSVNQYAPGAQMPRGMQMARRSGASGDVADMRDESELEFTPQPVRMSLTVTVTFHAEPRGHDIEKSVKRRRTADSDDDDRMSDFVH